MALLDEVLRDLHAEVVSRARQKVSDGSIDQAWARPLREVVTTTPADASRVFGEPLPYGLQLDVLEAHERP